MSDNKMYFLARIKDGARVAIDRTFLIWPQSDYEDEHNILAKLSDDMVFIATKVRAGMFRYDCVAPGFGTSDDYGNGSILVTDVDILSPGSLVMPTYDDLIVEQ